MSAIFTNTLEFRFDKQIVFTHLEETSLFKRVKTFNYTILHCMCWWSKPSKLLLFQCWDGVIDAEQTFKQHWVIVSCFLGVPIIRSLFHLCRFLLSLNSVLMKHFTKFVSYQLEFQLKFTHACAFYSASCMCSVHHYLFITL